MNMLHTTHFAVAAGPSELSVGLIIAIAVTAIVFIVAAVWLIRRARIEEGRERGPEAKKPLEAPPVARPKPLKPAKEKQKAPPEEVAPKHEAVRPPEELEAASFEKGLEKTTSEGFVSRLGKLFKGKQLDAGLLEEIEAVLYTSDIGVKTTERLLEGLRAELDRKSLQDAEKVWGYLRTQTLEMLEKANGDGARPDIAGGPRPYVLMVIGVNGTGKTTSIGKLAAQLTREGYRVLLAAGDTFRAAAVEQLEVWGRRVKVEVWKGAEGADPASVVFDAIAHAKKEGYDVVLADTAGRLHTHGGLVDELKKVHRVAGKAAAGAPHEVVLVLDSTMGQNAVQQARLFKEAVPLTGLILTKLDGTAKGGVVIGICDEMQLPIRYIGVGERIQDLRTFDSLAFVDALFGSAKG